MKRTGKLGAMEAAAKARREVGVAAEDAAVLDRLIDQMVDSTARASAAVDDALAAVAASEARIEKLEAEAAAASPEVANVWALKRSGQARDLERQRQGKLSGAEIGRGMAAVVRRVRKR